MCARILGDRNGIPPDAPYDNDDDGAVDDGSPRRKRRRHPDISEDGEDEAAVPATHQKPKRARYTVAAKVMYAQASQLLGAGTVCALFDIKRNTLRDWNARLPELHRDADIMKKTVRRVTVRHYPVLEDLLVQRIRVLRDMNMPVTVPVAMIEAERIRASLSCPAAEKCAPISACWTWNVMQRHGFTSRSITNSGRETAVDPEVIAAFIELGRHMCSGVPTSRILNVDEFSAHTESIPRRTYEQRGTRRVSLAMGGATKRNVTTALTVTADGKMLPPYVIARRKTVPKMFGVDGVVFGANEKSWMTAKEFIRYIKLIIEPYAETSGDGPLLLFATSVPTHFCAEVSTALSDGTIDRSISLVPIPKGHTDTLQPLDVAVMKPMRAHMQASWTMHAIQHADAGAPQKPPSLPTLAAWIRNAAHSIKWETIISGWEKAGYGKMFQLVPTPGAPTE